MSNALGHTEVFFHDGQQFDSCIMRWEDKYCPEPCGSADISGPCYIQVSCVLCQTFCSLFTTTAAES